VWICHRLLFRRPIWLTQTLQEAREHVEVLGYSMRVSIPPKTYSNHVAFASSTCELIGCFEEVWYNALVECDGWVTIAFQVTVVDYETVVGRNLQMAGLV
jgi:hypothetical protein